MKCDSLLEETLALPGEISTMTIGRFFNRDSDTMILGKKNVLSIFHYDGLNSTFIFDRHVQTYREVAFIRTSPQSHSLDCLFTLTVNGEWLFLQWNGSFFFPLAAGSLQEAVRPFVGVDHPHRFHVNSSLNFSVNLVQISTDSPAFFQIPSPASTSQSDPNTSSPELTTSSHLVPRISFRGLLIIEDNVCIGIQYDGPDSVWLSTFRETPHLAAQKMRDALNLPETVDIHLRNGLEHTWSFDNHSSNPYSVCIAKAETFAFVDRNDLSWDFEPPPNRFIDIVTKIRDFSFTTSLRLPEFPHYPPEFHSSMPQYPHVLPLFVFDPPLAAITTESVNSARALMIVDTGITVAVCGMFYNFANHTLRFLDFFICSQPITTSLLLPVPDPSLFLQTISHASLQPIRSLGFEGLSCIADAFCVSDEQHPQPLQENHNEPEVVYYPPDYDFIKLKETQPGLSMAERLRDVIVAHELLDRSLLIYNRNTFKTPTSPYRLAFASFDAHGISFFQTLDNYFRFTFPYSLRAPPTCVKFFPPIVNSINFSHFNKSPPIRHRSRNSSEKGTLVFGGGENVVCIVNGSFQKQFFPDKYIQGCLVATSCQWLINSPTSTEQHGEATSPVYTTDKGKEVLLKKGNTLVFFSTARNAPLLLSIDSGRFLDVSCDEDFCTNPMLIQNVFSVPLTNMGPRSKVDDSLVMGVGIGSAGALTVNNITHSLIPIRRGQWFERLPLMFSSKLFAGASLYSLLLICEHCNKGGEYEKQQNEQERTLRLKVLEESFEKVLETESNRRHIPPLYSPDESTTNSVFPLRSGVGNRRPMTKPEFRSTELALRPDSVDVIDGASIGIDSYHRTLTIGGAQGALVQVTSCEVRISPTVKYYGVVSGDPGTKQSLMIDPEPVYPDTAHGLRWHPPPLHTAEQVEYFVDHPPCYTCPCHLRKTHSMEKELQKETVPLCQGWKGGVRFVELELASVTDNLIATSCGSTVFVLLWTPMKPTLISKHQNKHQRGQTLVNSPTEPIFTYRKAQLQHIATLTFPSRVTALATATLCDRPFLLVGCRGDPKVRIFRADDIITAEKAVQSRNQYWNTISGTDDPIFNRLTVPDDPHHFQVRMEQVMLEGKREGITDEEKRQKLRDFLFFEMSPNCGLFVRNIHSTKCILTQLFTMDLEFNPNSILLTTFDRSIRSDPPVGASLEEDKGMDSNVVDRLTKDYYFEDTTNDNSTKTVTYHHRHLLNKTWVSSPTSTEDTEDWELENEEELPAYINRLPHKPFPPRVYSQRERAALLVGCEFGQLATTFIPLSSLLDFPPRSTSSSSLTSPILLPSLRSASNISHPLISHTTALPSIHFSWVGRSTVRLVDDASRVYVLAERAFHVTWDDDNGQLRWTAIAHQGQLHALLPVRVCEDVREGGVKKKKENGKANDVMKKEPNEGNDQKEQESQLTTPTPILTPDFDSPQSQPSSKSLFCPSTPIASTTPVVKAIEPGDTFSLAWIGLVERMLYFGALDPRKIIEKKQCILSSVPLAVTHLPAMHAFAVLCRESLPYRSRLDKAKDTEIVRNIVENAEGETNGRNPQEDQLVDPTKKSEVEVVSSDKLDELARSPPKREESDASSPRPCRCFSPDPSWKGSESAWTLLHYSHNKKVFSHGGDSGRASRNYLDSHRPFRNLMVVHFERVDEIRRRQIQEKRAREAQESRKEEEEMNTHTICESSSPQPTLFNQPSHRPPTLSNPLTNLLVPTTNPAESKNFYQYLPPSILHHPNTQLTYHQSIQSRWFNPPFDSNGVSFIDLLSDYYADSHEKLIRNYRPILQIPKISRPPSFCISPSTCFCTAHPSWLDSRNVQKAVVDNSIRLRPRVVKNPFLPTKMAMRSRKRALERVREAKKENERVSKQNLSQSHSTPITPTNPAEFHSPEQSVPLFGFSSVLPVPPIDTDLLISRISPPYVILLFDEDDMRTRIGRIDLSHIELLYGSLGDAEKEIQEQKPNQAGNPLQFLYDTPEIVSAVKMVKQTMEDLHCSQNSTRLFHWSCLTSLSLPTFEGMREMAQIEKSFLERIDVAVDSLQTDENSGQSEPKSEKSSNTNKLPPLNKLGKGMNVEQFQDHYVRSLIAVSGRESTQQITGLGLAEMHSGMDMFSEKAADSPSYESVYTDILIFEVKRQSLFGEAKKIAKSIANDNRTSPVDGTNDPESIQNRLAQLPFTYPELTTAPAISPASVTQLLNVDVNLVKMIRVLGPVQGLTSSPSTIYIMNGKHLHIVGVVNGDPELVTLDDMARFEDDVQTRSEDGDECRSLSDSEDFADSDDALPKTRNKLLINAVPPSHSCTCTIPLYTTIGKKRHRTVYYPAHISTTDVCDVSPVSQNLFPLYAPNMLRTEGANDEEREENQKKERKLRGSAGRITLQIMGGLEAPAPITSISVFGMDRMTYRTASYLSRQHKPHSSLACSEECVQCAFDELIPPCLQVPVRLRIALGFGVNGLAVASYSPPPGFPLTSILQTKASGLCIYYRTSIEHWTKHPFVMTKKKLIRSHTVTPMTPFTPYPAPENVDVSEIPSFSTLNTNFSSSTDPIRPKPNLQKSHDPSHKSSSSSKTSLLSPKSARSSARLPPLFSDPIMKVFGQLEVPHNTRLRKIKQPLPKQTVLSQMEYLRRQAQNTLMLNEADRARVDPDNAFLCKTASLSNVSFEIIAQCSTPSLLVDLCFLDADNLGLVIDGKTQIYSIVDNTCSVTDPTSPLISAADSLPSAFLLSAELPQHSHISFILRSTFGIQKPIPDYYVDFAKNLSDMFTDHPSVRSDVDVNRSPACKTPNEPDSSEAISINADSPSDPSVVSHSLSIPPSVRTPSNILDTLPELPPFLILSRHGSISRTTPIQTSNILCPTATQVAYMSLVRSAHFGDVWRSKQATLVEDFVNYESDCFKRYVKNEISSEKQRFGKLSYHLPQPHHHYVPPNVFLSTGRVKQVSLMLGLSPIPHSRKPFKSMPHLAQVFQSALMEIRWFFETRHSTFLKMRESERLTEEEEMMKYEKTHIRFHANEDAIKLAIPTLLLNKTKRAPLHHSPAAVPGFSLRTQTASHPTIRKPDPTPPNDLLPAVSPDYFGENLFISSHLPPSATSHTLTRDHSLSSLQMTDVSPLPALTPRFAEPDGEDADVDWMVSHPSAPFQSLAIRPQSHH